MVRALEAIADRDVPRGQVDQVGGDKKWRQPARPAVLQRDRAVADAGQAADSRADHHAGAFEFLLVVGEPAGVLDRLDRGRHREDDEPIHPALVLGRNPIVGIEQPRRAITERHLRRDLRRQVRHVKGLDRADPGHAGDQLTPDPLDPEPERRHEPHPGDDDAPHDRANPAPGAAPGGKPACGPDATTIASTLSRAIR